MEMVIPITNFDPSRVKLDQPRPISLRRTISFTYEDNQICFTNLILALHPLKVIDLDIEKKQITLEETKGSLLSKLEQFQKSINTELEKHPENWIEQGKIPSVVRNPLQQWIKAKRFTLYLSSDPSSLSTFDSSGPILFSKDTIKPGDMIRVIIKIHGISLQISEEDNWTGKSRIQHHILEIYKLA